MKQRKYWRYEWEIDEIPSISAWVEKWDFFICKHFAVRLKKWFDTFNNEDKVTLLLFIWALEEEWVFDKSEITISKWLDQTPAPTTYPYDPLKPSILYSDNTIPCQSGITGQWENG